MADFKSEFFNLERMRNTVMDRMGDYMKLPAKIDAMTDVVNKMQSARAADFKIVLPSLKTRVNAKINESLALKDQLFAFTDKVQANPELQKLIKGDVGLVEFALTSIFKKKTDVNQYASYISEAVKLSGKASTLVKNMEMLTAEINNVEQAIRNNVKLNPLPVEEPSTWQSKGAMYVGGAVLGLLAIGAVVKNLKKGK